MTFENVQAGERTSHLFRLANFHNGLVVGTGDLSELALGWCTYGVGDHMSHYAVNASVPKTLIQHVIRWVAETGELGEDASETLLQDPGHRDQPGAGPGQRPEDLGASQPSQSTEAKIGPYELHDFTLYYTLRYGYPPPKVAFLAYAAWHDVAARHLAGDPRGAPARVRPGADQEASGDLPVPLLPAQPVQAELHPERPEGRLGRLALAARRLPRPERRRGDGLAGAARAIPDEA